MDPADEEFLLQHLDWVQYISNDIREPPEDAIDWEALDGALKRELVNELGPRSHNHYFVAIYNSCQTYFYSPYDGDGGERAIIEAREAVIRKLHLSGLIDFCYEVDSQSWASSYFEEAKREGGLMSVADLAASSEAVSCLCRNTGVYLALQRTGNYIKGGKPIPEGARLFDKLKEEHARRCAGCPL